MALRHVLIATSLAALAGAGAATGSGIIRLTGGACAIIDHTKVCAIKQTPKTRTVTRTVRLTTTIPTTVTTTETVTTSGPPLASPPPVTTTTAVTTTTTVTTTPPPPVAKLCASPTDIAFGTVALGPSNIENYVQISNCGDLPVTIQPPTKGMPGYPFQARVEDLGNAIECPVSSGTYTLNPGAVCALAIDFPMSGVQWASGSYSDSWEWIGWTQPGVFVDSPLVHLSGTVA